MSKNQESVLLRTSAATDVVCSGGVLTIAGLNSATLKSRISAILQVKSKAEVVQVKTVGATSYVPTSNTIYTIELGDTTRMRNGIQETLKRYSMTTGTVSGVAATDRETVHAALVLAINADTSNFVTAASLGTGSGISITDAAGYFPPFTQTGRNRNGATTVRPCANPDDTGFLATNTATTTAAVYSSGIGANLLASVPVIDSMTGNLLSGYLQGDYAGVGPKTVAGLAAVSGQNYDTFVVLSLQDVSAHSQTGQFALAPKTQLVFVDNGTGTATTNAAGFVAFEREMLRHVFGVYANDPSAQVDFFDNALVASATYPTTGAAITTTDNVVMSTASGSNTWYVNPIGTHTLLTPLVDTGGFHPYLDVTSQEGVELSPPNLTQCPKECVVGKTEMSFYARFNIGSGIAATDYKTLSIGLRKKAAYAVDQTAYEAASVATVALGVPLDTGAAPIFNMITGPGAAGALTNTSTAVTPAVSTAHDLLVTVDINGVAKFYVNGVDKTPLLAATYTFTAGLHLMPFISFRHAANASAVPLVVQSAFVPSLSWRG